jgi:quercetin dioxygenase-like cupin family protein
MMVAGENRTVGKGDAIWIPPGAVHAMENGGEDVCVVLIQAALPR